MARLDEQPEIVRWPIRIIRHSLDGHAWIVSAIAALLAAGWVIETQIGGLPAHLSKEAANAVDYWTPRVALTLFLVILVQASARAGIDEERQRDRLDPQHVMDLKHQAIAFRQIVATPALNFTAVDTSALLATYFCQHLPDVAGSLRQWNHQVETWTRAAVSLRRKVEGDSIRPLAGIPMNLGPLVNLFAVGGFTPATTYTIHQGAVPLSMPEWPEAKLHTRMLHIAAHDTGQNEDLAIPPSVNEQTFLRDVEQWMTEAHNWPESRDYREELQKTKLLQARLLRQLDAAALSPRIGGGCEGCDPRKR